MNFCVPLLQHILSLWPTEHYLACNTQLRCTLVLLSKHTATMRFNTTTQMLDRYLTWDLTTYDCGARKGKFCIMVIYACMTQSPLIKNRDCIPGRSETTQKVNRTTGIFWKQTLVHEKIWPRSKDRHNISKKLI